MLFILLSALSSISVALLLKSARLRGIDTLQLIAWNYITALVLCGVVLKPSIAAAEKIILPWGWLVALAVLLPSIFYVYSRSLTQAGIIRTEIAQRLSLLIALTAAFTFMGDNLTPLKLAGIGCGFVAVALIASHKQRANDPNKHQWLWLLGVWVGYGVIDIALKQIAVSGVPIAIALAVTFGIAWLIMFAVVVARHHLNLSRLTFTNVYLGVALGLLNFANIAYYLKAHQTFATQPAIVFASMNFLVVVLGVLAGCFIYKEPLTTRLKLALLICLAAIGLLTSSQWH